MTEYLEIPFEVRGEDLDDKSLDNLIRQLRAEIKELDISSINYLSSEETPKGAKSGIDPDVIKGIVIGVSVSSVSQILSYLQAWIVRQQESKTVTINIPLPDGSNIELSRRLGSDEEKIIQTKLSNIFKKDS